VTVEIERLMKDDIAGDPISGIKWARKAAGKISLQLRQMRIWVSPSTVRRLLKKLDFHLHVNKKAICSTHSADRDRQFKSIRRARNRFERQGLPIISIDTKKREMIGLFKNPGAKWAKAATPVNDHDFLQDAVGVAVSYGIYDPQANRGHIVVGTSRDTSQFAGDALALWWKREGGNRYPDADRLLILADCGGSNSNRVPAWKCALQQKLCDAFGLRVTVAHYPPGTSKWNPIEHRLFSEISKNWAAQPLTSYQTMLNYIRTTKTKRGLRVRATLLKRDYLTGQKPDADQISRLRLRRHRALPAWNYTLAPAQQM
jgi:DDE family transposase